MFFNFMRAKIHLASVNQKNLDYVGSITIDSEILESVGMYPNEKVQVLDLNNGKRFETYVIEGKKGSKIIGLNGPAARMCETGDRVVIVAYAYGTEDEIKSIKPKIVVLNDKNEVISVE
jgi:aspartate 1-decarboxylase